MTLASAVPLENNKGFTYKDYLQWDDDRRWELIDGAVFNMTPAPSRKHQKISMELAWQLRTFLKDNSCEVYAAPFDVRLPEKDEPDDEIKTVVQPDISVICDKTKLDDRGCRGAPDLIIEIVSPFTARKDLKDKMFLYERCGVKEYWIVHPEEKILMRYKLENNRYGRAEIFSEEDTLRTVLLEGLEIELDAVFSE
jgi:Uma2 family endonuclease